MKRFSSLLSIALVCIAFSFAQKNNNIDPSELSYGDNLVMPEIPAKAISPIKKHLKSVHNWFTKHEYDVQMTRDSEVVLVTIPCADLFAPNSIELKESGLKYLQPFLVYLNHPTMYKIVVAVHSDNTGEPSYTDQLTSDRANAIDEYLYEMSGKENINLVPYGLGQDEPINDNTSIINRNNNRRVEFYIIPEWQMIDNAKAGKLK